MVQTVCGAIRLDELGLVAPHEHIFLDGFEVALTPELILDDPEIARAELERFRAAGGNTIIECTIHGLNPHPTGLRRLSEQLGIQIVAGTGLYWDRYYPGWAREMSEDDFARLLET